MCPACGLQFVYDFSGDHNGHCLKGTSLCEPLPVYGMFSWTTPLVWCVCVCASSATFSPQVILFGDSNGDLNDLVI